MFSAKGGHFSCTDFSGEVRHMLKSLSLNSMVLTILFIYYISIPSSHTPMGCLKAAYI